MEHIIGLLTILVFSMSVFVQSAPIQNGFAVKFNAISAKENISPKTFGALFAKIPQEFGPKDEQRKEIFSKALFPYSTELGKGCSNQIAKLSDPMKNEYNITGTMAWDSISPMNLPLIQQPYDDYKILVAMAPPNVKFGSDGKDLAVYVVFPDDGLNLANPLDLPKVYFVSESNSKMDAEKNEPVHPMFIIDSNRTVTGLKSNAVSKFVRFKNKLINSSKVMR